MSFFYYKPLVFSFLLINFTFTLQFLHSQTLIGSNFDQALLPFGSIGGTFISSCNRDYAAAAAAAASLTVLNNCSFTVWAAAVPGGGRRLNTGEAWILSLRLGTVGRVWGRTSCSFDDSGRGRCLTGDCDGVLQCRGYGAPPNTVAEFATGQFNNLDFFDLSLVDGFNIPVGFSPASGRCSRGPSCAADINGQCPLELRAPGGCNGPCTVFMTDEYCCSNGTKCGPTDFSRFFKDRCPDAYTYPRDDATSTFTCPGGTSYDVVFCPS